MSLYQLLKKRTLTNYYLMLKLKAYTSINKFKASDVALVNTRRIARNNVNEAFSTRIRETE